MRYDAERRNERILFAFIFLSTILLSFLGTSAREPIVKAVNLEID